MRVCERIHMVEHADFQVRVWAACDPAFTDGEALSQGNDIRAALYGRAHSAAAIAEAVAALPFTNAVEVRRIHPPNDGIRAGVLIYPDWP